MEQPEERSEQTRMVKVERRSQRLEHLVECSSLLSEVSCSRCMMRGGGTLGKGGGDGHSPARYVSFARQRLFIKNTAPVLWTDLYLWLQLDGLPRRCLADVAAVADRPLKEAANGAASEALPMAEVHRRPDRSRAEALCQEHERHLRRGRERHRGALGGGNGTRRAEPPPSASW